LPETPALYPAPRSTLSAGTEPLCGKKAAQGLLFYAFLFPGARGPAPGQTNVAGEDINCRCFLTYRMEKTTRESWQESFEAGAQKYRRLDREEGGAYPQRSAKDPNWEKWVATDRIVTYASPVYVSERVGIKPKELHIFYQDTGKAMQMFGVP